ncbi:MAG: hypothetical protein WC479_06835 [Candidatus Izemoplasmatales bacterium]|nr:hypothetical protein [Candidatus Izemoplasmatales bacterium]MDD3865636.1 hypothetical protein [Candidatus Izemoplasmatales bacterium]
MKKIIQMLLTILITFGFGLVLVGCNSTTTANLTTVTPTGTVTEEPTEEPPAPLYYVGASWNGYIANDPDSALTEIDGKDGWYTITVALTADNRDNACEGHFYKVTNGTWDSSGTWGAVNYALQPAPASTLGGLGSIYVSENQTLTILFDSTTHTVYDSSMIRYYDNPVIYGDFNSEMNRGSDYSLDPLEALELTDSDLDGVFTGEFTLPAYTGDGDGYAMAVVTSAQYAISIQWDYYGWGAKDQYKFDGTTAGMAGVSYLKPLSNTTYQFSYDSATHITTVTEYIVELATPIIYGSFCEWSLDPLAGAIVLVQDTVDPTLYTGSVTLDAGDEYAFDLVTTKVNYGEWGWGAGTQYLLSGYVAGIGQSSKIDLATQTTISFTYNSTTNVTNVVGATATENMNSPVIYGDFSGWSMTAEGGAVILVRTQEDPNIYVGSATLPAYTEDGSGWTFNVCTVLTSYGNYGWGAGTQYLFDGSVAGFGQSSTIDVETAAVYTFTYNATTHVTTFIIED